MRLLRSISQDGSASTEVVLVMPAVLLLVLLAVQFGLWLHAREVAVAAAQEGLVAAQRQAGTEESGAARAEAFIAQAGGVRQPAVRASRTAITASVEVTGTAPAVVPGMDLPITAIADGPVERFIAEPDR